MSFPHGQVPVLTSLPSGGKKKIEKLGIFFGPATSAADVGEVKTQTQLGSSSVMTDPLWVS